MNVPTLKKILINNLSYLSLPSEFGKNKLILITAAGTISGELVERADEEQKDLSSAVIAKLIGKVGDDYKKEHDIPDDQWLSGNDGYIVLKNVELRNGSSSTSIPVLAVFFDQIIAASVGNLN